MLHQKLINPSSIAVVGASDNIQSPGGKILNNLIEKGFKGKIFAVNPKSDQIQGITCYRDVEELPKTDMAIIAIAAQYCEATVKVLTDSKETKAFIIISAGFGETGHNGKILENKIVDMINNVGGTLLGPNNVGMFNTNFAGVFTTPIPVLDEKGVDFVSGSGATAVFIMENAIGKGLRFNSLITVGNSAQIGVEEVIQHWDETYYHGVSPKVKLLYLESITNPNLFLKHARSLVEKGAKLVAIKAGSSDAGSRAASSHTGAIANADTSVDALFQKAGIIRCYGREELVNVAGVLSYPDFDGKNLAIVTHAGGPAVMLTDVLSKNDLTVPQIHHPKTKELLSHLFAGSSANNPIDFLATGTAEQLGIILDFCNDFFDEIDAVAVIFGSPGLFNVDEVYNVLDKKIKTLKKPIFPILPSVINVKNEIRRFIDKGHFAFFDEVNFGNALGKVKKMRLIPLGENKNSTNKSNYLKELVKNENGYISFEKISKLFNYIEIPLVEEHILSSKNQFQKEVFKYPIVAKVIGPVHKTDVGGVRLNIKDDTEFLLQFEELMAIQGAEGVLVQPMLSGIEIFIGVKKDDSFGHTIVCGMGGIMVEVLKDVSLGLAPLSKEEINQMIKNLKLFPILKGYRGKKGISIEKFIDIIDKVNLLVQLLPEIEEMDINPLMANEHEIIAVDVRVRVSH